MDACPGQYGMMIILKKATKTVISIDLVHTSMQKRVFEIPRILDVFMIPIVGLSIGDPRCPAEFWISLTVELPTLAV